MSQSRASMAHDSPSLFLPKFYLVIVLVIYILLSIKPPCPSFFFLFFSFLYFNGKATHHSGDIVCPHQPNRLRMVIW